MSRFQRHDRILSRLTGESFMVIYDPGHGITCRGTPVYILQKFFSAKDTDVFVIPTKDVESGDFTLEISSTQGARGRLSD